MINMGLWEGVGEIEISLCPFGCGLWSNIMKEWNYFWENTSFKDSDGRSKL